MKDKLLHLALPTVKKKKRGIKPSERREVSATVQAAVQLTLPLGSYDSVDPVMLEAADRDDIWSLWQVRITESQCKPLGFCSKALPSCEITILLVRNKFWLADGP